MQFCYFHCLTGPLRPRRRCRLTIPTDEKFPELNDAILGSDELSALFRDYRACATINDIIVKPGPGYVPQQSRPTLDHAEELLRARAVRGIQIRYQFEQKTWCDTLMPLADNIRLVRIQS
jgi:hypothetical protein